MRCAECNGSTARDPWATGVQRCVRCGWQSSETPKSDAEAPPHNGQGALFVKHHKPDTHRTRGIRREATVREADKSRGLYRKFMVSRSDRRDAPGEKHHGCRHFVLDLDHDRYALAALGAYAEACKEEYPNFSFDLKQTLDSRLHPLRHPADTFQDIMDVDEDPDTPPGTGNSEGDGE